MQNEKNTKVITIGDLLRTLPKDTAVCLSHKENDDHNYIEREITETTTRECFVDFYGWHRLDGWKIIKSELKITTDVPVIHITYTEEK